MPQEEESLEERLEAAEEKAKGISDENIRNEVMQEIENIKKQLYHINEPPEIINTRSSISKIKIDKRVIFYEDEFEGSYVIELILPDKRVKDVLYKYGFVVEMPGDYDDATFKEVLDYICKGHSSGNKPIQTLKRKLKQGKDLELTVKVPESFSVELDEKVGEHIAEEAVNGVEYVYDGFRLDVKWKDAKRKT